MIDGSPDYIGGHRERQAKAKRAPAYRVDGSGIVSHCLHGYVRRRALVCYVNSGAICVLTS
jgi:hypothetical protein